MTNTKISIKTIRDFFIEAETKGSLQYVYTLLRIKGAGNERDSLAQAKKMIDSKTFIGVDEDFAVEILELIANLLNCCTNHCFVSFPFLNLYQGEFPNVVKPTSSDMLVDLIERLNLAGKKDFVTLLNSSNFEDNAPENRSSGEIKEFVKDFLNVYFEKRLEFNKTQKIYKMTDFVVLELLTEAEYGLYGFNKYFSNGAKASFERLKDSTLSLNILSASTPIGFSVGDWSKMQREWIMGDRKLYEVGLPSRYNTFGEWKPLEYKGDPDLLNKRLLVLLEEEKDKMDYYDLYGFFQYIMATCHHTIEFIVKTNIEFPYDINTFDVSKNKFTISLVKLDDPISNSCSNMFVYDCSIILYDISVENIRFAINSINTIFSRISFQVDSWHEIIYKYTGSSKSTGSLALHKKTDNLINYFSCFADEDSSRIDLAMEWYVGGNNSDNLFHKFLSYCIALESIAVPFIDGKLEISKEFGISYRKISTEEKLLLLKEIENDKDNPVNFNEDPLKFMERACFICTFPGLSKKIKKAIEKVFGDESLEIGMFSEKIKHKGDKRRYSIYDIRSRLAHGDFSLNNKDDLDLVEQKVSVISSLAQKFIMSLLSKKSKNKNITIEKIGGMSVCLVTADPRTTGITNNLNMVSNKDWKIKMNWLF